MTFIADDQIADVDSTVGACSLYRSSAIQLVGLMDETFFMYGEDLDWAKRIKDAGWEIWYNGQSEIPHVKRASSSQSGKARVDFYEAMWLFYRKHYQSKTPWLLDQAIMAGVAMKGGLDMARHLWRYSRQHR